MKISIQFILALSGLACAVLSFGLFGYARFSDMQFTANFNQHKLFHDLKMLLTESHETPSAHFHQAHQIPRDPKAGRNTRNNTHTARGVGVLRNSSDDESPPANNASANPAFRQDPVKKTEATYRSERTLMASAAAARRSAGTDLTLVDRHQGAIQVIIMILNWFIAMFSAAIFYVHFRKKLEDLKSKKQVTIFLVVHALACAITSVVTIDAVMSVNGVYLDLESMVTPENPMDGAMLVASCYKSFYETYFSKIVREKGGLRVREDNYTCDEFAVKILSAIFLGIAGIVYGVLAFVWGKASTEGGNQRRRSSGRSDSLTRPSVHNHKPRQAGQMHIGTLEAHDSRETVVAKRNRHWNFDNQESQASKFFR